MNPIHDLFYNEITNIIRTLNIKPKRLYIGVKTKLKLRLEQQLNPNFKNTKENQDELFGYPLYEVLEEEHVGIGI